MADQINNKEVNTIEEMVNIISNCNCDKLKIEYERENKKFF